MSLTDKYKVIQRISHGEISKAYLVVDKKTGTKYAFKVVKFSSADDVKNFEEVKILNSLDYDSLPKVKLFYADYQYNRACMLMPYIEGENLDIYLQRNGCVDIRTAYQWFCQLANVLRYIHIRNIVHRDIKPANVILDKNQKLWLIDFGSASYEGAIAKKVLTVEFAAPELLTERAARYYSDVYSLGKLMLALIGEAVYCNIVNIIDSESFYDSELNLKIKVVKIIRRCLMEEPLLRYQKASDLLVDLVEATE